MSDPVAVPKFRDTDGTYQPIYYHRAATSFTQTDKDTNNAIYTSALGEVRILDDIAFSAANYAAYGANTSTTLSPLAIKNLISDPNNISWPDDYTIPLSAIPSAALDTIVKYSSLTAASAAYYQDVTNDRETPFQVGDTIQLTVEPYTMYIVTGEPTSATDTSCYTEYAAGTAAKSLQADNATNAKNAEAADKLNVNAGSETQPVYFVNGVPVNTTYNLDIYQGATESSEGKYGLVPQPTASSDLLFLSNQEGEEWFNLTPSDINALSLEGGTLTGNLTMASGTALNADSVLPSTNNAGNVGSSAKKYENMYAYTFHGDLDGNAETATTAELAEGLNITLQMKGDVTTVSKALTGPYESLTTVAFDLQLGSGVVGTTELATNAVTTAKIAADAVTLAKLGSDVGTVYVGSAQPTDSNVKIWVQTS